jgi:hypothetical protein
VGPKWEAPSSTWHRHHAEVDALLATATQCFQDKHPPSLALQHSFDLAWRASYRHIGDEFSRNYGATHAVGDKATLKQDSPATLARTYQRGQRRANQWRWLQHRLTEGMAAHKSGRAPWTTGWSGWLTGILAHLDTMHSQHTLQDEDYWFWLAVAHRMPDPGFDLPAWRSVATAHADAQGNAVRKEQQADWDSKLGQALRDGTGWAHRITKPTAPSALPHIGETGNTSLTVQLAAQVTIWRA